MQGTEKEVLHVVEELELLLSELVNNEFLRKIDGNSKLSTLWNEILDEKFNANNFVTWFETEWLFAENYMYMRINEIFEKT